MKTTAFKMYVKNNYTIDEFPDYIIVDVIYSHGNYIAIERKSKKAATYFCYDPGYSCVAAIVSATMLIEMMFITGHKLIWDEKEQGYIKGEEAEIRDCLLCDEIDSEISKI